MVGHLANAAAICLLNCPLICPWVLGPVPPTRGVGNLADNPNPLSLVRCAGMDCAQHTPSRIKPHLGQVSRQTVVGRVRGALEVAPSVIDGGRVEHGVARRVLAAGLEVPEHVQEAQGHLIHQLEVGEVRFVDVQVVATQPADLFRIVGRHRHVGRSGGPLDRPEILGPMNDLVVPGTATQEVQLPLLITPPDYLFKLAPSLVINL